MDQGAGEGAGAEHVAAGDQGDLVRVLLLGVAASGATRGGPSRLATLLAMREPF